MDRYPTADEIAAATEAWERQKRLPAEMRKEIARLRAREDEARVVIEGLYELATGTCYCKPRDTTGACAYCAALVWLEGVKP